MDKKARQYLLIALSAVTLYAALMNLGVVLEYAGNFMALLRPVIAGAILALFIDVPMKGVENRLRRLTAKSKKPLTEKQLLVFSFFITLLLVVLACVLVLTMLVPELIQSTQSLIAQIRANIPAWREYWESRDLNIQWAEELIAGIQWDSLVQKLTDALDGVLGNVVALLTSTVSLVTTAAFALIISIYMSLEKKQLRRHTRKAIRAFVRPDWAEKFLRFCSLFHHSFSKFLYGQCSEALILGTLMFFAFTVFKLPYGSLVGVLTAFCAIIPYVGAFISCAISVFLTLLVAPKLVLPALIVYLVVQFIENQFIYPRVVGSSVGLSPLYTLIAAMIGGQMFGIMGILFFIPLAAVLLELVKESADRRLRSRKETHHEIS